MDLNRTKTADYRKDSLRKMSISFLTSNERGMLETECNVDVNAKRGCVSADQHQHHTSVVTTSSLHSEDRSGRIERWVASQSLMVATNFDSGYAANGGSGTLCDEGQWAEEQSNEQVKPVRPPIVTAFPDQRVLNNRRIPLDDLELSPPRDFTSSTPKRSQSLQLVYTHEEKLFIMHSRVIGSASWQDISKIFENIFGREGTKHTIPSLIKIYNRTCRDWRKHHGTHNGQCQSQSIERVVKAKLSEHVDRSFSPRAMSQA